MPSRFSQLKKAFDAIPVIPSGIVTFVTVEMSANELVPMTFTGRRVISVGIVTAELVPM